MKKESRNPPKLPQWHRGNDDTFSLTGSEIVAVHFGKTSESPLILGFREERPWLQFEKMKEMSA